MRGVNDSVFIVGDPEASYRRYSWHRVDMPQAPVRLDGGAI